MQDILSFTQAPSPITLAPSAHESPKMESGDGTFSESFFSIILGQYTKEAKQVPSAELTQELPSTTTLDISPTGQDAKSVDEHLLDDLLSVVNALQQNAQTTVFPTLSSSSTLEKILGSETARQDFANVKNVSDLMDLSKKYNLGLEKLSISQGNLESLQAKFPKLAESNFFDDLQSALNNVQTSQKSDATPLTTTTASAMNLLDKQSNQTDTKPAASILSELFSKETDTEPNVKSANTPTVAPSIPDTPVVDKSALIVNEKQQNTQPLPKETIQETPTPIETVTQKVVGTNETKKTTPTLPVDIEPQDVPIVVTTRTSEVKKEPLLKSDDEVTDITIIKTLKSEKTPDTALQEEITQVQKVVKHDEIETTSSDESQTTIDSKNDLKTTVKQDTSIKNTPVKESLNQFASDLKEKIEAYKPPIMKVELSLSPKNLGEVDVTLLTRGNNLHVNISSNTTTMSLFTQNQSDVKNALINMGFSNLEMNFSDQNNKEQSQQNNQKQNNGNVDEFNEDETALLEIVIPQYV